MSWSSFDVSDRLPVMNPGLTKEPLWIVLRQSSNSAKLPKISRMKWTSWKANIPMNTEDGFNSQRKKHGGKYISSSAEARQRGTSQGKEATRSQGRTMHDIRSQSTTKAKEAQAKAKKQQCNTHSLRLHNSASLTGLMFATPQHCVQPCLPIGNSTPQLHAAIATPQPIQRWRTTDSWNIFGRVTYNPSRNTLQPSTVGTLIQFRNTRYKPSAHQY